MKIILKLRDLANIKKFFEGDRDWSIGLNSNQRKNFVRKMTRFKLLDNKTYLIDNGVEKEIIADDDVSNLNALFDILHLPDHTGMTVMYEKYRLDYAGFRREHLYNYVAGCIIFKRHVPIARTAPITPIVAYSGACYLIGVFDIKWRF